MIDKKPEGFTFGATEWPLHITIASLFSTAWSSRETIDHLGTLLEGQRPVNTSALRHDNWGTEKNVAVTVMDTTPQLRQLHTDIVTFLQESGATFYEKFLFEKYDAHSTVQQHDKLEVGTDIVIDSVTLIDMFPDNNGYKRRLLGTIDFRT